MHYRDVYGNQNKVGQALFDVNKQISSGQKIQYAHEDTATFIDTMRLDNEITTLTQIKKSTESGYKFSTQTDTVLGDFSKTLDAIKVKLVSAANGAHSDTSLNAIAQELRGLQNHLSSLANTSINGQFLFSGSQTSTKPFDSNGNYVGNDGDLKAFLGEGVSQKYNISGADLFFGEENNIQRKISTNVKQLSLTDLYPDVMQDVNTPRSSALENYITPESTIRDLMGDSDTDTTNDATSHFYIRGTQSDGTSFKAQISMTSDQKVDELLNSIKSLFGSEQVNVTLNEHGQIEIEDKLKGSSKLDFHMVGAIDFDTTGADAADVTDIDDLDSGEKDFKKIADANSTAVNPDLYVKEFIKSSLTSAGTAATNIEGIVYDRTRFSQEGMVLEGNVSQILKDSNTFAVDSTKLGDIFSDLSSSLHVNGKHLDGTGFDIDINLGVSPVTVSGDYTYTVADGNGNDTVAADMTYRQLMDVVNMAINQQTPADNSAGYRAAIATANANSSVNLSQEGKIVFTETTSGVTSTQAAIAIYDSNTDDFTASASMATFNTNNTLSIRDPKTNFFAQLNEAILAVEERRLRADGSNGVDPRNVGIQNGIQIIDDLNDHVSRMQTQAGAQSQSLDAASTRSEMLILNTRTLRSEVLDTDIAEATLRLQQLQLNYQAMFSSISRISQLSLVNYL
jgi:flagellar hook-associated protein 3 FlgL